MSNFLNSKILVIVTLSLFFFGTFLFSRNNENTFSYKETISEYKPKIDGNTEKCISCHEKEGNGRSIVENWKKSLHGELGIGCIECHEADKNDADAFEHEGFTIATIVTPNDCAKCHPSESKEFQNSHHADAGMIMGSLDNVLAEVVEGNIAFNNGSNPAAVAGCHQCHGSKVELLKDKFGKVIKNKAGVIQYDPKTWPNTGIGRINLDGSKGSCSACHSRHDFSRELARNPENCGKCHQGPDHPQYEIYKLSKHGIAFEAHKDEMNLKSLEWVVGRDYTAAPTCATCHMSATPNMPVTHEVGSRISWTLRPKVSEKLNENGMSWEVRRSNMKNVCKECHENSVIEGHYTQFDNEVYLYNEKFGKPALKIMKLLKSEKLITPVAFDEKIEWSYFYLWHHEGRRARHGASMMAPDYTQWHGNFEVAQRWYTEMVPEIRDIIAKAKIEGKTASADKVEKELNKILNSDMHKWYLGKMNPEENEKRKNAAKEFRKRYSNN